MPVPVPSALPVHLTLIGAFVLLATIYLQIIVIYRLYFHPLTKYPGPLLARITNAYSLYHAWTGKRHLDLYRLHKRYGPVVRIGPNNLCFNSDTAYHQIYGSKANTRKADYYKYSNVSTNIFSTIDNRAAARKRRMCGQGFSDRSLKTLEPYITSNIDIFCDRLMSAAPDTPISETSKERWSPPRNMAHWTNYLSHDIIGDICYGKSFETLTSPTNTSTLAFIGGVGKLMYISGQMTWIIRSGLHYIAFLPYIRAWRKFVAFGDAVMEQRIRMGDRMEKKDMFQYLLEAKDPETGEGLNKQQIKDESMAFLIAGSDTVSIAFSSTIHYLLHSPHHLSHLTALTRTHFPTLASISPTSPLLHTLPFLRACIDESMRLSPSTPGIFPRHVLPPGAVIDGHSLPAHTQVGVCQYALHRNEWYFAAPEVYDPHRWLRDEEEVSRAKNAFVPFSVGPRTCLGKGLAYAELMVGVARLLWRYDLRLPEGGQAARGELKSNGEREAEAENYPLEDYLIACIDGPMVQVRARMDEKAGG